MPNKCTYVLKAHNSNNKYYYKTIANDFILKHNILPHKKIAKKG